jgi:hypothetical protein
MTQHVAFDPTGNGAFPSETSLKTIRDISKESLYVVKRWFIDGRKNYKKKFKFTFVMRVERNMSPEAKENWKQKMSLAKQNMSPEAKERISQNISLYSTAKYVT